MKSSDSLESKSGDQLYVMPNDEGLIITVVPAQPPFDPSIMDVFNLGLKFISLARALASIRAGSVFRTDDKNATFRLEHNEARLEFQSQHGRFLVECDLPTTDKLLTLIEDHLFGRIALPPAPPQATGAVAGRNAPCPCGSGRKYKKCCLNAAIATENPDHETAKYEFEVLRGLRGGITDDLAIKIWSAGETNTEELASPGYWSALGCALGSSGDHVGARAVFEAARRLFPREREFDINLAVTLNDLGSSADAIDLLNTCPTGSRRLAIVKANILHSMSKHEEAIPLYELAIAEEPSFDLPYLKLAECLEITGSTLLDYWVDRAVRSIRDSPAIAVLWARRLFVSQRLEELAHAAWIDRLRARVGDTSMVDRRSHEPREIIEAQLWRACGQLVIKPSLAMLDRALELEAGSRALGGGCDPSRVLLVIATQLGARDQAEQIHERLCLRCREATGGIEFVRAAAASGAGDWANAVHWAAAHAALCPTHLPTLWTYWWALDELERPSEALEIAERMYGLGVRQGDLLYNLGFLAGKAGCHGKASYYYEEALTVDPKHPYARENLVLTQALNGELDLAKDNATKRRKELCEIVAESGLSRRQRCDLQSRADRKVQSMAALLAEAERTMGSATYLLDLVEYDKQLDPRIGSAVAIPEQPLSLEETLSSLSKAGSASWAEALQRLRTRERGDLSDVVGSLREEIPGLAELPLECRHALYEAERRYSEGGIRDYSPEVVGYGKAVEIALKSVFDDFKARGLVEVDVRKEVEIALQDRFKQATTFVRYIERGPFIELGGMVHTLRLTGGKTGEELALLSRLREFIVEAAGLPAILDKAFLTNCDLLANLRNPAAHATSSDRGRAREARRLGVAALNALTEPGQGAA